MRTLLVVGIALLSCVALAKAQSAAERKQTEAEYQHALKDALVEFQAGNWEEARVQFERAHALQPSARTLRGLGITAFEERHYVAAVAYLRASLDDRRKPLTASQRTEVSALLERADGYVTRLVLEIAPADASVRLDGRPAEIGADHTLLLDPGNHEIAVGAPEHVEEVRRLSARAGEQQTLSFALSPTPSPVAAVVAPELPAPTPRDTAPRPAPEAGATQRTWAWIATGVAVAGVGVAGLGLGLRASALSDWNDDDKCLVSGRTRAQNCGDDRDAADSAQAIAIVGAAVGVAAAATAIVLFLTAGDSEAAQAAQHACAPLATVGMRCEVQF